MSVLWSNIIGYAMVLLLAFGFVCIAWGYAIAWKDYFARFPRKEALKRMRLSAQIPVDRPKKAIKLVSVGASNCLLVIVAFGLMVVFAPSPCR